MLTKIMETCNLQMKDVDSSLKAKLIIDSTAISSLSNNTPHQSETGSSDNESIVEKVSVKNNTRRRHKFKQSRNTGPKVFTKMPESNKVPNRKNDKSYDNHCSSRTYQNENPTNTTAAINEMNFKMAKFLNISSANRPNYFDNSNILTTENLRNVQTQSQVEEYTHQLYQHISANNYTHPHQMNIPSTSTGYYGMHNTGNPTFPNFHSMPQYSQFQNQQPPSLLDVRPQINQQNATSHFDINKTRQKKWTSKNK